MATPQTELSRADKWFCDALTVPGVVALVGDRIYRAKAPRDAASPVLIVAYQGGVDRNVVGGQRLVSMCRYAVRAVVWQPTVDDLADQVAAAADVALLAASADSHTLCVERMEPLNRSYTLDGIEYEERGGLYRVYVKGD